MTETLGALHVDYLLFNEWCVFRAVLVASFEFTEVFLGTGFCAGRPTVLVHYMVALRLYTSSKGRLEHCSFSPLHQRAVESGIMFLADRAKLRGYNKMQQRKGTLSHASREIHALLTCPLSYAQEQSYLESSRILPSHRYLWDQASLLALEVSWTMAPAL